MACFNQSYQPRYLRLRTTGSTAEVGREPVELETLAALIEVDAAWSFEFSGSCCCVVAAVGWAQVNNNGVALHAAAEEPLRYHLNGEVVQELC
mmetsp:Transcript_19776/g.44418  ORF Transcript_19776/g.44418 Transcript_19776/m.44418 type:complete len:93 (-) Transcript_19776:93-371(-)